MFWLTGRGSGGEERPWVDRGHSWVMHLVSRCPFRENAASGTSAGRPTSPQAIKPSCNRAIKPPQAMQAMYTVLETSSVIIKGRGSRQRFRPCPRYFNTMRANAMKRGDLGMESQNIAPSAPLSPVRWAAIIFIMAWTFCRPKQASFRHPPSLGRGLSSFPSPMRS